MRRILAALAICLPLGGCYPMPGAGGPLGALARSPPIDDAAADPATTEGTRARLALVVEAREFAVRELAMPDGKSFRRYADLGRPFAIWSVVATPEFSIEPRRWGFPIAGCVPYLGSFAPVRAPPRPGPL